MVKKLKNANEQQLITIHFSFFTKKSYLCNRKNRGVAQLVAFLVWDQAVAGSSPVTSTKFIRRNQRDWFRLFFKEKVWLYTAFYVILSQ